jgi:hypothetical protein
MADKTQGVWLDVGHEDARVWVGRERHAALNLSHEGMVALYGLLHQWALDGYPRGEHYTKRYKISGEGS